MCVYQGHPVVNRYQFKHNGTINVAVVSVVASHCSYYRLPATHPLRSALPWRRERASVRTKSTTGSRSPLHSSWPVVAWMTPEVSLPRILLAVLYHSAVRVHEFGVEQGPKLYLMLVLPATQ